MAEEVVEYEVHDEQFPTDTFNIKTELIDDKVVTSETAISAGYDQLQDYVSSDLIKRLEFKYIKTESLPEIHSGMDNESVKAEAEVNVAGDIKMEIDADTGSLFCENCCAYYEDYCTTCGMLLHILNKNVLSNADNKVQDIMPQGILEIRYIKEQQGIFALKVIPKGVKFGPFIGLDTTKCPWKIKGGRFILNDDKYSGVNWMQHINPARCTSEQNLLAFQCEDNFYYKSNREIQKGEELFVYFGDEFHDNLENNIEMDYIPTMSVDVNDIFACTFCCLGFNSRSSLAKHKSVCLHESSKICSTEELTQCPFCKIYLNETEYTEHHMVYCCESNVSFRYTIPQALDNQASQEITCSPQVHKAPFECSECQYQTKDSNYLTRHMRIKHFGKVLYQCVSCEYNTCYKWSLRNHTKSVHLKEFAHHCELCEYKSNKREALETHIKAIHLKTYDYECESCEYKTSRKGLLNKHIKTKHLKTYDYECESCSYRTNEKKYLLVHVKTRHLKKFDYECGLCKYKTNLKGLFNKHTKTKHLKIYDYECESCPYKTYERRYLELHVKSTHLKEFVYECESCEYKSNQKRYFEKHMKLKHPK